MTSQKKLRETQEQALKICQSISVREYCLKVHFLVHNLTNPRSDGDCHSNSFKVLGDALTSLIEMQQFFKMPVIDQTFARQLYVAKRKTITVTNKKTKERFKIKLTTESIDMSHWQYFIDNFLFKTEQFTI